MPSTIFLIDDDQDDIDILKEAVAEIEPRALCLGYIYPEEAIRVMTGTEMLISPDYIFIDINMPVITGDKCLKMIRAEKRFDNIVVIMYSTSMPDGVADNLKKAGANYVFEKPIRLDGYFTILREILK